MTLSGDIIAAWLARNHEQVCETVKPIVTASELVVEPVYTPLSIERSGSESELEWYSRRLGLPGEPPFTRGIEPGMYRQRHWVMGMYSGRASPQATNERIRSLLAAGQGGFSIALDLPTQLGMDSDDPLAHGEVGRVGVPLDTLQDMVDLLADVPLDRVAQIRTTANAIGPIAVALFIAAAEVHGYSPQSFKVMLQNDALKEYISRHTQIFPCRKGRDFSVDVIEYCARELPHWEPIEFCGYHIRDSGSTAVQEVAIAIANGIEYIDSALRRGLTIDDVGHSLYMFLSAGLDIFEEVAKFRAARRIWADLMVERYQATKPSARALNIFCYTLGSAQTASEPHNNLIRIAYQALAAALGGVQTLATSSYDEALGLPSPEAARLGLRTQQILALETGVTRSADPMGGSYHVEALTDALEIEIRAYLDRIDKEGGALAALESGFLEGDITDQAFRLQRRIENGQIPVVGVNCFTSATTDQPEVEREDDPRALQELEGVQVANLRAIRSRRDAAAVERSLAAVRMAARDDVNTIPAILSAVRAYATVGEITQALADVWGRFDANHF